MKKRVLYCIDLSEDSLEVIKSELQNLDLSNMKEVHLVHAFQYQIYSDNFLISTSPGIDEQEGLLGALKEVLLGILPEDLSSEDRNKFILKPLISASSKDVIAEYAKRSEIDEMVIATRSKHGVQGFFSSSFAEYMVRHAQCQLRIIRLPEGK